MAPTPEFRLQAVHLFLTYPQCSIGKDQLLSALTVLISASGCEVKHYCIAQEDHEDGSKHAHAYLGLDKKLRMRGENCLDIVYDGVTYHGNYQAARKPKDVIAYCKKDGDFITNVTESSKRKANDIYADALKADGAEEFMRIISAEAPRDFVLNYERIEALAAKRFKPQVPAYSGRTLDEFNNVPVACLDWCLENVFNPQPERPKSLLLYGPTRLGKTEWARALGKHVYFNGMFNLDLWDDDAQYAVFDDMDWKFFINWKCWLGAQKDFSCTDKYRRKMNLKWGHPTIWLSNNDPLERREDGTYVQGHSETDAAWIRNNCVIVQAWQPFWV